MTNIQIQRTGIRSNITIPLSAGKSLRLNEYIRGNGDYAATGFPFKPRIAMHPLVPEFEKIKPFAIKHHTGKSGQRGFRFVTQIAIPELVGYLCLWHRIEKDGELRPAGMYINRGAGYAHSPHNISRRYNVSLQEAIELKRRRATETCGICKRKRKLGIDHNHKTDVVRGLLCNPCNSSLGWYEKHKEIVDAYLAGAGRDEGGKPPA